MRNVSENDFVRSKDMYSEIKESKCKLIKKKKKIYC